MTLAELKAVRDAIEAEGIGIYLPVMQRLFAAIDAHVAAELAKLKAAQK